MLFLFVTLNKITQEVVNSEHLWYVCRVVNYMKLLQKYSSDDSCEMLNVRKKET